MKLTLARKLNNYELRYRQCLYKFNERILLKKLV